MSTAILVCGMHRSGTSAVTGALQLAGISLGRGLLAPAADNPKGYFENERAVEIHERLLDALGSSWDDVRPLPKDWVKSAGAKEAKNSIRRLVEEEFGGDSLWAIKDPRICRFLPLWCSVLDEFGIAGVALMIVRKPAEVAASIAARNGWAPALGNLLWMRHVFESEAATRDLPRSVISYQDLLQDPAGSLRDAMSRLGVKTQFEDSNSRLVEFVDSSQRHHTTSYPATGKLDALLEEAYSQLVSIEKGGGRWQQVQAIGERAEAILADWSPYIEAVADKAARHRADLAKMEIVRYEVQSQLNAQIQWSEEAVAKESALHGQLAETYAQRDQLALKALAVEAEYGNLHARYEQLANDMSLLSASSAHRELELAQSKDRLMRTEQELAQSKQKLAVSEDELARQLERVAEQLAENARLDALVLDLEEARRSVASEKSQLEGHVRYLENLRDALLLENRELKSNIIDFSLQLDQIRNSRSWRLTRPLRGVANVLRSFFHRIAALGRGR